MIRGRPALGDVGDDLAQVRADVLCAHGAVEFALEADRLLERCPTVPAAR